MTTVAITKKEARIARPLKILVPLIQTELASGDQAGLEHYRRAGTMLLEARSQVLTWRWGIWLSKNFELSDRTARRYMRLARQEDTDDSATPRPNQTLHEAIREPRSDETNAAWRKVAAEARKINRELFSEAPKDDKSETKLHRDLALELVDLGYRSLALRLHPDQGGSRDAMRRLNRVRDVLKSFASHGRF